MVGSRSRLVVAAVALGFGLALFLGAAGIGRDTKALGAGTTLTVLSGAVSVRHAGGDFTTAVDGEVLTDGDAVHTGPDGRAVLTYFEGSSVTIEPSTDLAIDSATALSDGSTVVRMTQLAGRTWHVVTKLITGGSKYEVRTPASTASVRGTEFQVDASNDETTVTTTEGTVVAQVADPSAPGTSVDVPVTAGTTHTQPRNAPPARPRPAPEPDRKVTVTVGASNTLIVDPLGRTNGVTKDGKLVVQTPGAQVKRDGGRIVITLPNLPDGALAARVEKRDGGDDGDVDVKATVEEKGRTTEIAAKATVGTDRSAKNKSTGFELRRAADGSTQERALDESETKALPSGKPATETPDPSRVPRRSQTAKPSARDADETRRPEATGRDTPEPSPTRRAQSSASPRSNDQPSRPIDVGLPALPIAVPTKPPDLTRP